MTDFVQLQEDLTFALLSLETLSDVNIVQYRKLRLQSEIDFSAIWMTLRAARSGAGVLVEMPTARVQSPNVSGPAFDLTQTFLVLEEPNLNFTPETGTLKSAEVIAQLILEALHLFNLQGIGTLTGEGIAEASEVPPGILAYRVSFKLTVGRPQTTRCAAPVISLAAGLATLTTTTSDAEIRYTLDGTFPGAANPAAQIYSAPVAVNSGETIRCATWKTGCNPSEVRSQTA